MTCIGMASIKMNRSNYRSKPGKQKESNPIQTVEIWFLLSSSCHEMKVQLHAILLQMLTLLTRKFSFINKWANTLNQCMLWLLCKHKYKFRLIKVMLFLSFVIILQQAKSSRCQLSCILAVFRKGTANGNVTKGRKSKVPDTSCLQWTKHHSATIYYISLTTPFLIEYLSVSIARNLSELL